MSFLNKVTFRNLFRYKKRLFMTVSGILRLYGITCRWNGKLKTPSQI